ncbi:MAG TPA: membrane-bound lytic murein transglycosylase MltF [Rhodocyclaceae bacterium]|nr:membrane-bound lytic murein transglycosylase MltF [Rhodocyclaceae bacterium]
MLPFARFFKYLLVLLLTACVRLPSPQESGELVVGIRETPAFYQPEERGAEGFEYDLTTQFAHELGLKLRFVTAADPSELLELLAAGKIHMAAAMPLIGGQTLLPTIKLRSTTQWIVAHRDSLWPNTLDDLKGQTVEAIEGSAQAAYLGGLNEAQRPKLVAHKGIGEIELLHKVATRYSDLVATDDIHFSLAQNQYPDLRAAVRLPGRSDFGWVFANDHGKLLQSQAEAFIQQTHRNGSFERIEDRYFGHINRADAANIAQLAKDATIILPHFRREFQRAQAQTGIDWRLLAALAYQESKWDPLATSPTGVRGMMMLTEGTADHLNVKNRLDPAESILGGAKYLAEISDLLPNSVEYPDRIWLALSAYNIGMGHFNGARSIAKSMNRNPDIWYEMKQVLPLLAQPHVYARLKSGKARGGEAVILVENVRSYFDTLTRLEKPYDTPYTPSLALR